MKKYLLISALILSLTPLSVDAAIFNVKAGTSFKFSLSRLFSVFYRASAVSAPAGCTTSYANLGGTGDRRLTQPAVIAVTASGVGISMQGGGGATDSHWVDSNFAPGQGFFGGGTITGPTTDWVQFDFGAGHTPTINEWTYYQQTSDGQGTWKIQGSNDASSWTDLGSSFALGGVTTETITAPSSNTTQYRYYRLAGVSGTTSANPWVYEMEFKICGY